MTKNQSATLSGAGHSWLRNTLISSQAMMAMLLLVCGGLLIKSLANVSRIDIGLNADKLVTFRLSPDLNGYSTTRAQEFFARLERDLAALPGVTAVTAAQISLLAGSSSGIDVSVQGFKRTPESDSFARSNKIGAGYFNAMGIPLLAGREFSSADAIDMPKVAVVNQAFVRKFGLGTDVIGKWMSPHGGTELDTLIVGLVQDSKYNEVKGKTPPQVFLPYRQDASIGQLGFYVRTSGKPELALAMAAKTVARLDPTLPIEDPKTFARQIQENIFMDRLLGGLCVGFAAIATLLAAFGLYGVLAYSVSQRTREIGIRMALGAQPGKVAWPIVRSALRFAGIGVIVGGIGALMLARVIRSLLYGVEPDDWTAMAGAALLLLALASIAAWLPARRATKVDPLAALRTE